MADVAESFGVTKVRVCQMLALLRKLPSEITDAITDTENERFRTFFSGRRLRPLTKIADQTEEIRQFHNPVHET